MNYLKIYIELIERCNNRIYNKSIHYKHHINPRFEDKKSKEIIFVTFKEHYIIHHLRWKIYQKIQDKLAYLMIKGVKHNEAQKLYCSIGGKTGGKTTKNNNKGIFNKDYNRSKQPIKNWSNNDIRLKIVSNIFDRCSNGGKTTKKNNKGIFDLDKQYLRSFWASVGGMALKKANNYGGFASKKWRNENKELAAKNSSKGGSIGGKFVGKLLWWTNGVSNIRSMECPDKFFYRGMIKKRRDLN